MTGSEYKAADKACHVHALSSSSSTSTSTMATQGFQFNHTMYRVKDYKKSLDFYTRIMGMSLLDTHEGGDFTLFFLAFDKPGVNETAEEKKAGKFSREGILELTYNHGTEKEEGDVYSNGNTDPGRGFGHIAITVPDIKAACEYFESQGVNWKKVRGKRSGVTQLTPPNSVSQMAK